MSKRIDHLLNTEQLLLAYDKVAGLYPYIPPLSHWRAWEYAAYQHFSLEGRILDLGCGDGRFFRLLWPHAFDVVGVDIDPAVAELGRQNGIYREIHVVPAQRLPVPDSSFDHVFANCSLEHMDDLDEVLAEIHRCLKPGGALLCSVVTDRFVQWSQLPNLMTQAGYDTAADALQKQLIEYHHLSNPLSMNSWDQSFLRTGLITEECVPILPKYNTIMWLFMDSLWHIKRITGGEIGELIFSALSENPKFPGAFRNIFAGLLQMETDFADCGGAVFSVRKQG